MYFTLVFGNILNDSKRRASYVKKAKFTSYVNKSGGVYLLLLATLLYVVIFLYGPMVGVIMAFTDNSPSWGLFGSPWAGLKYFDKFFNSYNF